MGDFVVQASQKQDGVPAHERLQQRLEGYRKHHSNNKAHYEVYASAEYEKIKEDTKLLHQKWLEGKNKKNKSKVNVKNEFSQNSVSKDFQQQNKPKPKVNAVRPMVMVAPSTEMHNQTYHDNKCYINKNNQCGPIANDREFSIKTNDSLMNNKPDINKGKNVAIKGNQVNNNINNNKFTSNKNPSNTMTKSLSNSSMNNNNANVQLNINVGVNQTSNGITFVLTTPNNNSLSTNLNVCSNNNENNNIQNSTSNNTEESCEGSLLFEEGLPFGDRDRDDEMDEEFKKILEASATDGEPIDFEFFNTFDFNDMTPLPSDSDSKTDKSLVVSAEEANNVVPFATEQGSFKQLERSISNNMSKFSSIIGETTGPAAEKLKHLAAKHNNNQVVSSQAQVYNTKLYSQHLPESRGMLANNKTNSEMPAYNQTTYHNNFNNNNMNYYRCVPNYNESKSSIQPLPSSLSSSSSVSKEPPPSYSQAIPVNPLQTASIDAKQLMQHQQLLQKDLKQENPSQVVPDKPPESADHFKLMQQQLRQQQMVQQHFNMNTSNNNNFYMQQQQYNFMQQRQQRQRMLVYERHHPYQQHHEMMKSNEYLVYRQQQQQQFFMKQQQQHMLQQQMMQQQQHSMMMYKQQRPTNPSSYHHTSFPPTDSAIIPSVNHQPPLKTIEVDNNWNQSFKSNTPATQQHIQQNVYMQQKQPFYNNNNNQDMMCRGETYQTQQYVKPSENNMLEVNKVPPSQQQIQKQHQKIQQQKMQQQQIQLQQQQQQIQLQQQQMQRQQMQQQFSGHNMAAPIKTPSEMLSSHNYSYY